MVDQITTAATQRRTVAQDRQSGGNDDPVETLLRAERYDRVRVAPLDVTLRVLNVLGDFGAEGIRAAGDETAFLLVAESDPELPDVRIDRWSGSTFRTALRTSRVRVERDRDERVFCVPAGVRIDRTQRTGGGRSRLRSDGGRPTIGAVRSLTAGDRVRVSGEAFGELVATVDRIDESPPIASELFERAHHVFLDVDGERYRILSYQTMNGDDAVHLDQRDGGLGGTWQRCGSCSRVERLDRPDERVSP